MLRVVMAPSSRVMEGELSGTIQGDPGGLRPQV